MFETVMNLLETIQKKNEWAKVPMEAFLKFCKDFYNLARNQVEFCIEEAEDLGLVLIDDCGRLGFA